MIGRHLPPAVPPVTLRAVQAGVTASWGSGDAARQWLQPRIGEEFDGAAVVLTDSGTSALRLALKGTMRATGRAEVLLPGYGCFDLATAAIGAGCRVRLYDVDPGTLSPEWSSLECGLSSSVAAVVIAPFCGLPIDVGRARVIAGRFGAVVVEDAAQGVGARLGGKLLGASGSLGVLSFGRGKGRTGGGGGALLGNDDLGRRIVLAAARDIGPPDSERILAPVKAAALWALGRPALYGVPASLPWFRLGETVYRPPHEPRGMSAFAAGMLRATWLLEADAGRRRIELAREWTRFLGACAAIRIPTLVAGGIPGWLRFPVLVGDASLRRRLHQASRLGVAASYPIPLSALTPLKPSLVGPSAPLAGAERLAQDLYTLPTHGFVSSDDIRKLVHLLAPAALALPSDSRE